MLVDSRVSAILQHKIWGHPVRQLNLQQLAAKGLTPALHCDQCTQQQAALLRCKQHVLSSGCLLQTASLERPLTCIFPDNSGGRALLHLIAAGS